MRDPTHASKTAALLSPRGSPMAERRFSREAPNKLRANRIAARRAQKQARKAASKAASGQSPPAYPKRGKGRKGSQRNASEASQKEVNDALWHAATVSSLPCPACVEGR